MLPPSAPPCWYELSSSLSNAGTFTPAPDNLGGKNMGSEFPPRLDYNNVTTNVDTGRSIDLRISNLTSYNGRRSATPASGRFGAINMKRDPSMNATLSLDFSFVDSETKEPVELSKFSIFFVDIDSNYAGDHECVGSRDYERLMLADNTVLEQGALTTEEEAEQQAEGATFYCGSGQQSSNVIDPTDPLLLTEVQRQHTIGFSFIQASFARIWLRQSKGQAQGKTIKYAFRAAVLPNCPSPPPALPPPMLPPSAPPCWYELSSSLSNAGTFTPAPDNLGGKNMGSEFPPRLDYNNVTTNVDTGRSIDLRISNLTSYNGRRSATPASGRFGAINMKRDPSMNATLSLDFSFVDSETKEPVELSKFSIFFVDIDSNSAGDHECVGSRDYERLSLKCSGSTRSASASSRQALRASGYASRKARHKEKPLSTLFAQPFSRIAPHHRLRYRPLCSHLLHHPAGMN